MASSLVEGDLLVGGRSFLLLRAASRLLLRFEAGAAGVIIVVILLMIFMVRYGCWNEMCGCCVRLGSV